MKPITRALYAWNWMRLLRQRRRLSRERLLSSGRAISLSRRMDRRCAAILRMERRLSRP